MTPKEKLSFLLQYHRNLSIQLSAARNLTSVQSLHNNLGKLEEEIESLLYEKESHERLGFNPLEDFERRSR